MGERPKVLLPVLIVAGVLAVAVVVAVVLLLSQPQTPAVVPSPTPTTASPSATPTPSVTPSPSPTASATASEVIVGARGFEIVADDGSGLYTYEWDDDAAAAVNALSEAFDAQPTESVFEGDGTHHADYASYRWDGFELRDMIEIPYGKPRAEHTRPSYVSITGNSVEGIAITPEFGLAVGMTGDDVRALDPDDEDAREADSTNPSPGIRFFFGTERYDRIDERPLEYSVWVYLDEGTDTVSEIISRPHSRPGVGPDNG